MASVALRAIPVFRKPGFAVALTVLIHQHGATINTDKTADPDPEQTAVLSKAR
jgi:hypothetical protein